MKKYLYLLPLLLLAGCCGNSEIVKGPAYSAKMQKEQMNRGLVAIHNGNGNVSVSWRYQETDPIDIAFDIYRQTNGGEKVKLNDTPVTKSTFYIDHNVDTTVENIYTVQIAGKEDVESGAKFTMTPNMAAKPYLEIPIKEVEGFEYGTYTPNDASVADLDGDGEYEIVVKLETTTYDNSRSGICNEGLLIDAYKMDGTFMWRVDLGLNIRQGAHYTQMSLYDFDGDGKAELAVKTSEGTTFGDGTTIGDTDGDGRTDYRDLDPQSKTYGMILEGPEFLSVIDGMTGKELARADYISRDDTFSFGDDEGNRVDRFLAGAGYFDGKRPSILICRGYYTRAVLEAWDWRNGKLTKRWRFDTTANDDEYMQYEKQGNHNLRIGDVDGDGKDEVVYGACMIDHDGTGGYTTGLEHGDAMHMSDLIPSRPGLEVWSSHETSPLRAGSEMRDAATGELIWGFPSSSDVGRALTADIDPRFEGWEVWSSGTNGVYTADGRIISENKPSVNFAIWWDGDLNRELLDGSSKTMAMGMMPQGAPQGPMPGAPQMMPQGPQGAPQGAPQAQGAPQMMPQMMPQGAPAQGQMPRMPRVDNSRIMKISKWTGDGVTMFTLPGEDEIAANNGSKANPVISADLFGDWREELVVRTADNKTLRIYMTDIPTDYRFHTLMSDPIYRMSVLCENICYNQPPEPGYYLGSDLGKFWQIRNMRDMSQGFSRGERAKGLSGRLKNTTEVVMKDIVVYSNIADKYTLDARLDYDSYEWTINGKVLSHDRKLTLKQADYGYDKPISIGIKTTYKGQVFEDQGTLTFSSETGHKGEWDERDAQRTGRYEF